MSKRSVYSKQRNYPKQKWSINVTDVAIAIFNVASNQFSNNTVNLVVNPSRTSAAGATQTQSASILKVGRFKFRGVLNGASNAYTSVLVYIAYVPEGYSISTGSGISTSSIGNQLFYQHPEWVMAWTRKDYYSNEQSNEISLTSSLKRNLNPGDSIVLCCMNINNSSGSSSGQGNSNLAGTCQYVARLN